MTTQALKLLSKLEAVSSSSNTFYRVSAEASTFLGLKLQADPEAYESTKLNSKQVVECTSFLDEAGIDTVRNIVTLGYGDVSFIVDTKVDAVELAKAINNKAKKATDAYLTRLDGDGTVKYNAQIEHPVDFKGYVTNPDPEIMNNF